MKPVMNFAAYWLLLNSMNSNFGRGDIESIHIDVDKSNLHDNLIVGKVTRRLGGGGYDNRKFTLKGNKLTAFGKTRTVKDESAPAEQRRAA